MKKRKIYLVGMPSSGKSTIGKFAAAHFGLPFIDLDKVIVDHEGMEITEIFKLKGEGYFRDLERNCLIQQVEKNGGFVLATGGGAPCFFDNMALMNKSGITVFLEVSIDDLFYKLSSKGTDQRPLLKDLTKEALYNELKTKLEDRIEFYKQAKICLDQDFNGVTGRVSQVVSALEALEEETSSE